MIKKFIVKVTETNQVCAIIEAMNKDEAVELALAVYNDGNLCRNVSSFSDFEVEEKK